MMKKALIALGILFMIAAAAILTASADEQNSESASTVGTVPDASADGVQILSITCWVQSGGTVTKHTLTPDPGGPHLIIDINPYDDLSVTVRVQYAGPAGTWGMFNALEDYTNIQSLPLKAGTTKTIHINKGFSYQSAGTRTLVFRVSGNGLEKYQVIDVTV